MPVRGRDWRAGSWLKPGVVVVDARYNNGNIGDVHSTEAVQVAAQITPLPGGVGR